MESPRQSLPVEVCGRSRRLARRRSLAVFAALAVLLHAMFLGGGDWAGVGRKREPAAGAPMMVRSVDAKAEPAETKPAAAPPPPRPPKPPRAPRPRQPRLAASLPAEAGVGLVEPPSEPAAPAASAAVPSEANAAPASAPAASETAATAAPAALAASSSFLAAGELPPPVYRIKLPPSVNLRYEVRRGIFRGTGAIRWQQVGDDYGLRLEASIAGLTLLEQTSQGIVGAAGLEPVRFLDQRARRAALAANFNRDSRAITFSGASVVWPLLPGTQDQLSWMIQLAGIVAAEPERASEGGRISMVIVGARGDAGVRTLRFAGLEEAQTARGTVPALKFVVDGRSAYDSSYEIWLDPARSFLPVHATQRNVAGGSEFDLLLERLEPGP